MELDKIIGDLIQLCQEQQIGISIDIGSHAGAHQVIIRCASGNQKVRECYYIPGGVLSRKNYLAGEVDVEIAYNFKKDIAALKKSMEK